MIVDAIKLAKMLPLHPLIVRNYRFSITISFASIFLSFICFAVALFALLLMLAAGPFDSINDTEFLKWRYEESGTGDFN